MFNHLKIEVSISLGLILLAAFPVSALASVMRCSTVNVSVKAGSESELTRVCAAVQKGRSFLIPLGLDLPEDLTVKLAGKMPPNGNEGAIGLFDIRRNEITLLNYETFARGGRQGAPLFGIPPNTQIWESFVIHELAHAAAKKGFAAGVPVYTASEYIAVVAQIATLSDAQRQLILERYSDLTGFDASGEISFGYYLLDPSSFSISAWLHFSRQENGPAFIHKLLREGLSDD